MDFPVAEKFIQEVVWRTYWKGALHLNPGIWHSYVERASELASMAPGASWGPLYEAAFQGKTHLSYFNEWIQELTSTGYLHNHVRMWFASIWIFTFKIPWQLGAAFMYRYLLDGDPASNTLSWRWVAGLHTKGKTYLARADNISKYSEGRWNPRDGELAAEPFPVEDSVRCMPRPMVTEGAFRNTPHTGLVVSTDDLSIENALDTRGYSSVCLYDSSPGEFSGGKRAFVHQAREDLRARLAAQRGESTVPIVFDHSALSTWRESNSLDRVMFVLPHVGPLRDPLEEWAGALLAMGTAVGVLSRTWDSELFPLCDKGFFTMWERFKRRWARGSPLSGCSDASGIHGDKSF
jgi:deoxyribodipyrimidine photo-lyase